MIETARYLTMDWTIIENGAAAAEAGDGGGNVEGVVMVAAAAPLAGLFRRRRRGFLSSGKGADMSNTAGVRACVAYCKVAKWTQQRYCKLEAPLTTRTLLVLHASHRIIASHRSSLDAPVGPRSETTNVMMMTIGN